MSDAVQGAIEPLAQAIRIVETLADPLFVRTTPLAPGASVGRHLRHCLDVYDALLAGLASGAVDYGHRERELASETQRPRALARLRGLVGRLESLSSATLASEIEVRTEGPWPARSTVGRELQYLASHAIHHLALIAIVLRAHGHEVPDELGVAPSSAVR